MNSFPFKTVISTPFMKNHAALVQTASKNLFLTSQSKPWKTLSIERNTNSFELVEWLNHCKLTKLTLDQDFKTEKVSIFKIKRLGFTLSNAHTSQEIVKEGLWNNMEQVLFILKDCQLTGNPFYYDQYVILILLQVIKSLFTKVINCK